MTEREQTVWAALAVMLLAFALAFALFDPSAAPIISLTVGGFANLSLAVLHPRRP